MQNKIQKSSIPNQSLNQGSTSVNLFQNVHNQLATHATNKEILEEPEGRNIIKICITGGPCAGKTTGLSILYEKLTDIGYSVFMAPEAATLLGNGGVNIDLKNYTKAQRIQFQLYLMKVQTRIEQHLVSIASFQPNNKSVILCDRGMLDGFGYLEKSEIEEMIRDDYFKRNNLDITQLRDKQYDSVIHMVTAANGAEDHYNQDQLVRRESIEEARVIDDKLIKAWVGHPNYYKIDNINKNFDEKIQDLQNVVYKILGLQNMINNQQQRKFLLIDNDYDTLFPSDLEINIFYVHDTFLYYNSRDENNQEQYVRVRKRIGQDQAPIYGWTKTTFKPGKEKETIKKQINWKDYDHIISKTDENRQPLEKYRNVFTWKEQICHIDEYFNAGKNFSILSIKHNVNQKLIIPEFLAQKIKRDITDEKAYKIKYLAKVNWYLPSQEKNSNINKDLRNDSFDI